MTSRQTTVVYTVFRIQPFPPLGYAPSADTSLTKVGREACKVFHVIKKI